MCIFCVRETANSFLIKPFFDLDLHSGLFPPLTGLFSAVSCQLSPTIHKHYAYIRVISHLQRLETNQMPAMFHFKDFRKHPRGYRIFKVYPSISHTFHFFIPFLFTEGRIQNVTHKVNPPVAQKAPPPSPRLNPEPHSVMQQHVRIQR
jgi:hypothetical protein